MRIMSVSDLFKYFIVRVFVLGGQEDSGGVGRELSAWRRESRTRERGKESLR